MLKIIISEESNQDRSMYAKSTGKLTERDEHMKGNVVCLADDTRCAAVMALYQ